MKKALQVARWEFLTTITRRAYLFAVLGMPILFVIAGGLSTLAMPSIVRGDRVTAVGLIDKAGIVDLAFARAQADKRERSRLSPGGGGGRQDLTPFADVETALKALTDNRLASVYVIETDYMQTGNITAYNRNVSALNRFADLQRVGAVTDAIRSSLMKGSLDDQRLDRVYAPAARLKTLNVGGSGKVEDAGAEGFDIGRFTGTFGLFVLFTMSIFFSAGFLQQATIEDRQNRTFEVLLSSVDANELLAGKIIGLGGAGLLQVGLYLVLIVLPGSSMFPLFHVPALKVLLLLVYFINGYLLFACLMATVGMIGRTAQESAQLSAIWTLTASAPMFVITNLAASPNGPLARALSMFPLTSPITMMFRLTTSSDIPWIDVVLSIAIGTVSIYLCLRGAAKIFRAATLMYGKRVTLPELIRWLRA